MSGYRRKTAATNFGKFHIDEAPLADTILDAMCSRPISWLCCLLAGLAPILALGKADAHAHEHRSSAAAVSEHSHEDGHVPHHRHDHDGEPIPLSLEAGTAAARTGLVSVWHLPPILIDPLVNAVAEIPALSCCRMPDDRRSRSPTAPAPGDTLPLLI